MPKTRIRGARAPKNNKVKRPVSSGFTRRKKKGHEHVIFLLKNTKKQDVHRCKICKHHFISPFEYERAMTVLPTFISCTGDFFRESTGPRSIQFFSNASDR